MRRGGIAHTRSSTVVGGVLLKSLDPYIDNKTHKKILPIVDPQGKEAIKLCIKMRFHAVSASSASD